MYADIPYSTTARRCVIGTDHTNTMFFGLRNCQLEGFTHGDDA